MRPVTVKNYERWLQPWVAWLEAKAEGGRRHVDAQLLKSYLDSRFAGKARTSYMRVGGQLADFTSRYLVSKLEVIKPVAIRRADENVQMPPRTLKKLISVC